MSPVLGLSGARWRALRAPLLLACLLACFYAPLANPRATLATRDMLEYHLPMRISFAHLASVGLPQWDPFAHGGQPLLSNPNYAALYPLSWLALLLPPAMALNLVLIHVAFAAWARTAWHAGSERCAGARGDRLRLRADLSPPYPPSPAQLPAL
jgi:hypothetical protein